MDDIDTPGAKGFKFREGSWLFAGFVVRSPGGVAGFVDSCPHAQWPLSPLDDRYLTRTGEKILCSGHGALFTLEGRCIAGPCLGDHLTPWAVEARDGAVFTT